MGKSKFLRIIGGLTALLFLFLPRTALAEAPQNGAKAYALAEASTGRILASKNAEEQLPMASTTKIMTAILAIEKGDPDEIVTVPQECQGIEGTSIYLSGGETLPLRDLICGLMLASGNDAAETIAYHIGGNLEEFARMMNEKAKEIGAENTNFITPHGLPCEGHYTTAEDLAKIAAYAMRNETFREIVGTASLDIPADEDSPARYLRNKNRLLWQYDGGNGVKTGYTDAAGKCLVGGAERGGMQLITVVLNDRQMFPDTMALLDYGFAEYSMRQVLQKNTTLGTVSVENSMTKSVNFCAEEDIFLPMRADEGNMIEKRIIVSEVLCAPFAEHAEIGALEVFFDGELIKRVSLYTETGAEEMTFLQKLKERVAGWFD